MGTLNGAPTMNHHHARLAARLVAAIACATCALPGFAQSAAHTARYHDGTMLRTVTLESWKAKAAGVGVDRIAAGVDAALPDTAKFYSELLPHIEKVKSLVDAMPDLTLDQNIARSVAMATISASICPSRSTRRSTGPR